MDVSTKNNTQYYEMFNYKIKKDDKGTYIEQILLDHFNYLEEIVYDITTNIDINSNIFECISLYVFTIYNVPIYNDDITQLSSNHFKVTVQIKKYFKHKNCNGLPIFLNACMTSISKLYFKEQFEDNIIDSLHIYMSGSKKLEQNMKNLIITNDKN